jgi:hypothetical protein
MRGSVLFLLVALVLVTGILPRHRCTPAGNDGPGTTLFCDAHGHEGPCDHEGDGHDHESDGAPCCTHSAADPTAPPASAGFDVEAPAQAAFATVVDTATARSVPARTTWHVPIRRPPTETVVLLR